MVFDRVKKMGEWLGRNVNLESKFGNSHGKVLYGVRKPMASQLTPLIECEHGSREKIESEKPNYYFVSDEHTGLKIPLIVYSVNNDRIRAIARSAGSIFWATLVKDYN